MSKISIQEILERYGNDVSYDITSGKLLRTRVITVEEEITLGLGCQLEHQPEFQKTEAPKLVAREPAARKLTAKITAERVAYLKDLRRQYPNYSMEQLLQRVSEYGWSTSTGYRALRGEYDERFTDTPMGVPPAFDLLPLKQQQDFKREFLVLCNSKGILVDFWCLMRDFAMSVTGRKQTLAGLFSLFNKTYTPDNPYKDLSRTERLVVVDMYRNGYDVDYIAKKMRCNDKSIYDVVDKADSKKGKWQIGKDNKMVRKYRVRELIEKENYGFLDLVEYYETSGFSLSKVLDRLAEGDEDFKKVVDLVRQYWDDGDDDDGYGFVDEEEAKSTDPLRLTIPRTYGMPTPLAPY